MLPGHPKCIPQAIATDNLLEGFPHLLASKSVNKRVDDGVAHNEDEVHVEMRHEAHTVKVSRTGDHEDEVEKERSPADDEDAQENS